MKSYFLYPIWLVALLAFTSSCKKEGKDIYSTFNSETHFKPAIQKTSFFSLREYDFVWEIVDPLILYVEETGFTKGTENLSPGQKSLLFWWLLDGQVSNGGFIQFFRNGFGNYTPTIVKGLKLINDKQSLPLVQKAGAVYSKNKAQIHSGQAASQEALNMGSYFTELDLKYLSVQKETLQLFEKYIRANPQEFCTDENGEEMNANFSGLCKSFYPDGIVKVEMTVRNGRTDGVLKKFFSDGGSESLETWKGGIATGDRKEWWPNGNIKLETSVASDSITKIHYLETGGKSRLESFNKDLVEHGEFKEWHENGELKEISYYVDGELNGSLIRYYPNKKKELEAIYTIGEPSYKNYWNEKGKQLLKNGDGVFISDYSSMDAEWRSEVAYKNEKKNGIETVFKNGVLHKTSFYKNGIKEGEEKIFFENGKVKEVAIYKNGQVQSSKTFPLYNNPVPVTNFEFEMSDMWLTNRTLKTADSYPVCINAKKVSKQVPAAEALLTPNYQDMSGSIQMLLTIDETGNVKKIDFLSAYIATGKEVENAVPNLKFKPAMKDGQPVKSYIMLKAELRLKEGSVTSEK